MKKSTWLGLGTLLCLGLEYLMGWNFLKDITPFPYNECWLKAVDGLLRDLLLAGIVYLLYRRRGRIKDRVARYFPVVVLGVGYLLLGAFMISYLELDTGFLTLLSYCTGLFNNIAILLVVAMCYHHWPNLGMRVLYFVVYFLSGVLLIFDAIYFWTTSMHVESVLFHNLNIYAFQGIWATTATWQLVVLGVVLLVWVLLFRVSKPQRRKPNFTWSLVCLIAFGLVTNLGYFTIASGAYQLEDQIPGLGLEVEIEKNRQPARRMLTVPVNVNFVQKAFVDTDKVVKEPWKFTEKKLSNSTLGVLQEMGIQENVEHPPLQSPQYDRVVLLILESVHRDYLHFYNSNIPEATTPYLDSLAMRYPRIDKYYSSDIPTTQGLNATFRSQLIYDGDLAGEQPSLFRSVQAAGFKGIFINASSRYYANEYREYPAQFGMAEYYAKEDITKWGYTGASGWGFHNDTMYAAALELLEKHRNEKMLLAVKTLDMHQPYPYYGFSYEEMPESVRDSKAATIYGMYWVDQTIKRFFEQAAQRGLLDDRTLFVITADHNPHSGGEYKTLVPREEDTQSIAPIPIIFVSKNLLPLDALRTAEYASQEDLAPTLLYLLGLKIPESFMGQVLVKPRAHPYALGYFGGKGYYYSDTLSFVAQLDAEHPDTVQKDALADYLTAKYIKRHIEATKK